jgi:dipeptidyl aminopeptidase/acylaminoacyl peptidase
LLGISCGVPQLEGDLGEHLEVSSCVSAIVDYFGPSDFVLRGKSQPEMAYSDQAGSYALLGGKDGKIDSAIELAASPAEYVRRSSPPLLVFHGELDSRVLMDQSERIVELYRTKERPVDIVRVPDAGHGGLKFFMDDNFRRLVDFLDKYLR